MLLNATGSALDIGRVSRFDFFVHTRQELGKTPGPCPQYQNLPNAMGKPMPAPRTVETL